MGKSERAKGRRFELRVRNLLRSLSGWSAERVDQTETALDHPDVEAAYRGVSFGLECKARKTQCSLSYLLSELNALKDNNPDLDFHAVVAHLDRRSPAVIIDLDDFTRLTKLLGDLPPLRGGDN